MWLTCCPEAPKEAYDVADMLSKAIVAKKKKKKSDYLLKIISSVCYLEHHGLSLRADGPRNDFDSNFLSVIAFETRRLSRHSCFSEKKERVAIYFT